MRLVEFELLNTFLLVKADCLESHDQSAIFLFTLRHLYGIFDVNVLQHFIDTAALTKTLLDQNYSILALWGKDKVQLK